jgi:hypothetical protein
MPMCTGGHVLRSVLASDRCFHGLVRRYVGSSLNLWLVTKAGRHTPCSIIACSAFHRSAMLPRWLRPKTVSGHPDCGSRALFPFLERAVSAALSYPISCRWVSHRPVTEAPQLREDGGPTGNRTRVRGFAVLYVTTPPSGPDCVKAAQMLRFSAAVNRDLPPCRNNPVAALRRCRSERENTVT